MSLGDSCFDIRNQSRNIIFSSTSTVDLLRTRPNSALPMSTVQNLLSNKVVSISAKKHRPSQNRCSGSIEWINAQPQKGWFHGILEHVVCGVITKQKSAVQGCAVKSGRFWAGSHRFMFEFPTLLVVWEDSPSPCNSFGVPKVVTSLWQDGAGPKKRNHRIALCGAQLFEAPEVPQKHCLCCCEEV